jgi:tetratricopeptide (TPR) repeat protein
VRLHLSVVRAIWAMVLALALGVGFATVRVAAAQPQVDIAPLIQTAQHDFELGNYLVAIKTLKAATSQNSLSAEAFFWLGRSYYELRDFDNAVVHAEKAVSLDAQNSLYHQWLGRAYGGKADRERSFFLAKKVKKELVEAVRLNPSNIEARIDLEDFCISAPWIVGGNKDEAREQVDAIAALDAVEGLAARGKFELEAMKRPDAAENEFRRILSAKANRIEPYLEAVAFFEKQNKLAEMQAAVDAAKRTREHDPRVAYFQAAQWVLSGMEPAHAEEYLKSYLASTPERSDWPSHAAAREWLGKLYESQGKRTEAVEQYRASLQLEPGRKGVMGRLQKLEKASP